MTRLIEPQPGILDIALYQGGASHVAGVENVIKLSSNENPFGAPESAKTAFAKAAHNLHRYPNTDHASLRKAIADVHGLDPDRIVCGVGSDEIITFLCQAYAGVGDEVIYTEHGFSMYRISAQAVGATPVCVPERERVVDVDAILDACGERTKLVFIANPANPTGTMIGQREVARLAAGLPPQAILVLDGAYAEFVEAFDGGAALVENQRQCRDDADLFENLRSGRGCAWVGAMVLRTSWMCSIVCAVLSTCPSRSSPPQRPRSRIVTGSRNAAKTTPGCAPGWPRR